MIIKLTPFRKHVHDFILYHMVNVCFLILFTIIWYKTLDYPSLWIICGRKKMVQNSKGLEILWQHGLVLLLSFLFRLIDSWVLQNFYKFQWLLVFVYFVGTWGVAIIAFITMLLTLLFFLCFPFLCGYFIVLYITAVDLFTKNKIIK